MYNATTTHNHCYDNDNNNNKKKKKTNNTDMCVYIYIYIYTHVLCNFWHPRRICKLRGASNVQAPGERERGGLARAVGGAWIAPTSALPSRLRSRTHARRACGSSRSPAPSVNPPFSISRSPLVGRGGDTVGTYRTQTYKFDLFELIL